MLLNSEIKLYLHSLTNACITWLAENNPDKNFHFPLTAGNIVTRHSGSVKAIYDRSYQKEIMTC
ncbi:hypothetical protein HK11_02710 [Acetobacter sp. DmW_043]|nr:hypothetical protein HK11_02710 [Acetobacter sp. DmW_043]OUJ09672.1 hypothetical protein HK25_10980 [Acetobacter sp. DsW_059]